MFEIIGFVGAVYLLGYSVKRIMQTEEIIKKIQEKGNKNENT